MSSSSAPSPDPQIGQAALRNAALAEQATAFYFDEYEKYRPRMEKSMDLSDLVTQFQLDSSRENAAIAQEYNDYMMETFRPIEQTLIDKAYDYNTTGRQEKEAAKAMTDVTQAFDKQRAITERNNERMGINPNAGNAQSIDGSLDIAEALGSVQAANQARSSVEAIGDAKLADAALMGRGLASNQATSTQIASRQASQGQTANAVGNNQHLNGLSIQGQGYQIGMQGNASAANILNQDYQNRVSAWQAENSAQAGNIAGFASLAGAAAAFMADGGRVDEAELEEVPQDNGVAMGDVIDHDTQKPVAKQGRIQGPGTETSDSIPAQLSKGEAVLNAGALKILDAVFGEDALDNINEAGLGLRSVT